MELSTFALLPIEVIQDKRLTLEQTRVLIALFSFRGKTTNTVWPSRDAISQRTGMHIANISKATTRLVELGWLSKTGNGGCSKATRYTLEIPSIFDDAETVAQSATVAQQATLPVAQSATRPVAQQARGKEHTNEHTKEETIDIALADLFAEFWKSYPKKVGKDKAIKAFAKRKPNKVLLDEMLVAIEKQKSSRQWVDGYIPHPSTWLNDGRWMDEVESFAKPSNKIPAPENFANKDYGQGIRLI